MHEQMSGEKKEKGSLRWPGLEQTGKAHYAVTLEKKEFLTSYCSHLT